MLTAPAALVSIIKEVPSPSDSNSESEVLELPHSTRPASSSALSDHTYLNVLRPHHCGSHTEFQGLGPPPLDLGCPGDIYIDIAPGNHDVYAHLQESWKKWCSPIYRSGLLIHHPSRPDLYLCCSSRTGPTWNPTSRRAPTELNDLGRLATIAERIAGYLETCSKDALAKAKRKRNGTTIPSQRGKKKIQIPQTNTEKSVPAKRKKGTRETDSDRPMTKKPPSTSQSGRTYPSGSEKHPNNILSFPVERLPQTFVSPTVPNCPGSFDIHPDGRCVIHFSHFWGSSAPSSALGVAGDIFFLVSPQVHRIFIRLHTWVEWLGLYASDSPWIGHPVVRGMVVWIDGTEATWITLPGFVFRCQMLQGLGSSPQILIKAHDCVAELLPRTEFKFLPSYFQGFKDYGLLLSWKVDLEHFKEKTSQLQEENLTLKAKLDGGTSIAVNIPGSRVETDTISEASFPRPLPWPQNLARYSSSAIQTSRSGSVAPLMVNKSTSPLHSPSTVSLDSAPSDDDPTGAPVNRSSTPSVEERVRDEVASATDGALSLTNGDAQEIILEIPKVQSRDSFEGGDLTRSFDDVNSASASQTLTQISGSNFEEPLVSPVPSNRNTPLGTCPHVTTLAVSCHSDSRGVDVNSPDPEVVNDDAAIRRPLLHAVESPVQPGLVPSNPLETRTGVPEFADISTLRTLPPASSRIVDNISVIHDIPREKLDRPKLPDEDRYLSIVFHDPGSSGNRLCRLCLQLDIPKVIKYPLTADNNRLLMHCETQHSEMHHILAGMSSQQLADIYKQLEALRPT